MELQIISFKKKWAKLKQELTDSDLEFFYKVIHGGEEISRVLTCSGRDFNPKYMSHYFPVCRCHTNVLFAVYLLNNRKLVGKYKVITNDKHSAIINTENNQIYDPTYDANGVDLNTTLEQFKEKYDIIDFEKHILRL